MKIHFLLGLVGLAIGFAAPGFAQEKEADPQAVEQLRAEAKKFEEAYNNHDAAAVAALFTDDAVLVTPHGTFSGRKAIEEKYEEEDFRAYHGSNMISTTERATAVGNEIHLARRWSATYQSGGTTIRIEGNASPVFVLEGDTWKIRYETVEVTKKDVSTPSPTTTPSNQ